MLISTMLLIITLILLAAGFGKSFQNELGISRKEMFFIPLSALFLSPVKIEFGMESELSAACMFLPIAYTSIALSGKKDRRDLFIALASAPVVGALAYLPIFTGKEHFIYLAALLPCVVCVLYGAKAALLSSALAPVFSSLIGTVSAVHEFGSAEYILSENAAVFTIASFILLIPVSHFNSFFAEKKAIKQAHVR